jgi:hypothetical protein
MNSSITLSVGEEFHLKRGKDRIVYAGMLSEDIFSIVQRKREALPYGWYGQAWNLYYPKNRGEIVIDGITLYIESISADSIGFRLG